MPFVFSITVTNTTIWTGSENSSRLEIFHSSTASLYGPANSNSMDGMAAGDNGWRQGLLKVMTLSEKQTHNYIQRVSLQGCLAT